MPLSDMMLYEIAKRAMANKQADYGRQDNHTYMAQSASSFGHDLGDDASRASIAMYQVEQAAVRASWFR